MLTWFYDIPASCPAAEPLLPISHKSRQNQAEGGTAKIKANPLPCKRVPMLHTLYAIDVVVAPFQHGAEVGRTSAG